MVHPISKGRLMMYCICLFLTLVLPYVLWQGVAAVHLRNLTSNGWAAYPGTAALYAGRAPGQVRTIELALDLQQVSDSERQQFLQTIEKPDGVRGISSEDFRIDVEHLAQIPSDQLEQMRNETLAQSAKYKVHATQPPVIEHSYLDAIAEAIFFPLSASSNGRVRLADGSFRPYPAPVKMYATLAGQFTPLYLSKLRRLGLEVCSVALITFGMPVAFILLPASRRNARVRWGHFLRITVYSFAMLLVVIWMYAAAGLLTLFDVEAAIIHLVPLVYWIILPTWWAVAIKHYLHMPHGPLIAALLTLVLALLASPLLQYVFPYWIVGLILN